MINLTTAQAWITSACDTCTRTRSWLSYHTTMLLAAVTAVSLVGCSEPPVELPKAIPAVKVFTVGKQASGQSRRLSGIINAADTSPLSFGVGGRVIELLVAVGESVDEGQLLASLDPEPLQIKLTDKRAKLNNARAQLLEAKTALERTRALLEQRAASQQELETAAAKFANKESSLQQAQADLTQAELDFDHRQLLAPVAGKVAKVGIDNFQEVSGAEQVITLQSDQLLEVAVRVPETMIRYLDYAQVVQVAFPSLPSAAIHGVVSQIGASAEDGNAFPVTITLGGSDGDLRPGMTAAVTFNFDAYLNQRVAYLIPLSAIAIDRGLANAQKYRRSDGNTESQVPVFLFDADAGLLREQSVTAGQLRGNEIEIYAGLEPGDQVVSAGVTFVSDGMAAKAWRPDSPQTGVAQP